MKKNRLFSVLILLISLTFSAQNGYIYVHKKASSENSSVNFSFDLMQGKTSIKTFDLNDSPDALNAFDLGNSHGSGEGQLWAVINDGSNSASTHNVTGTLFTRAVNSQQWKTTANSVTDVRSVDGIDTNKAVYSTTNGDVKIYNSNDTLSNIWSAVSHGGIKIIDVASGGSLGVIVAVGNDGKLYKYTGTGTNDSWAPFSNSNVADVYRADVNPTDQEIVFIRTSTKSVYRLASSNITNTPTAIAEPTGANSVGNDLRDIAISNEGHIYANYNDTTGENIVFDYVTSWIGNAKARGLSGLTSGAGEQAWGITKVNTTQGIKHTIYTRAFPGTTGDILVADWLDDERVRTSVVNGNSIMIPVPPGTYSLTESDTNGWNKSTILLYDPTNKKSSNGSISTTNIKVAAGEVVNVVYSNTVENSITVPALCNTNNILSFGSGTAAYGPAIAGFTSYHYRNAGIVGDGYYSLVKNSSEWYSNQNVTLTDHTGNPGGYFAMFNASYATDDFFRQTVTGLSKGTLYEFAFWVADLSPNAAIRPNITMGITNSSTGEVINSINTGDFSSTVWKQYKFNFVATSTTGEIFLKNNSIGGSGNDLAIDDITFAPAPPALSPPAPPTGVTLLCSNPPTQFQFTNPQSGGTWSTSTPSLISINASTGMVTTVAGQTGTATILYSYSSSSGCSNTVMFSINVGPCACYNDPATGTAGEATQQGITLLQRAAADNGNWPMIRKSAFTVLESNSKGFVITRMTSDPAESTAANYITKITNPQEGMMIYDTFAKCLKLYDGTIWSCFNTPACP